jgi:hypothetical protein
MVPILGEKTGWNATTGQNGHWYYALLLNIDPETRETLSTLESTEGNEGEEPHIALMALFIKLCRTVEARRQSAN